jgi:membrane peptidoglycan carboxypeptidase
MQGGIGASRKFLFKLTFQAVWQQAQASSEERKFADRDGIDWPRVATALTGLLSGLSQGAES